MVEIQRLVLAELSRRGLKVKENSICTKTHNEQDYDDADVTVDGIEVELED
jgi:hypothetical protein